MPHPRSISTKGFAEEENTTHRQESKDMVERSEGIREASYDSAESDKKPNVELFGEGGNDLQMTPERMLDLARKAAELLVERIVNLPGQDAWDGEFRQELERQLMEDPPEEGRPAAGVLERAAREILPVTLRLDHPRSFGFIPSSPT